MPTYKFARKFESFAEIEADTLEEAESILFDADPWEGNNFPDWYDDELIAIDDGTDDVPVYRKMPAVIVYGDEQLVVGECKVAVCQPFDDTDIEWETEAFGTNADLVNDLRERLSSLQSAMEVIDYRMSHPKGPLPYELERLQQLGLKIEQDIARIRMWLARCES